MLWVKRLLPFVLIALAYGGCRVWDQYRLDRRKAETRHWAELTTTIWEASARYHDQPDSFLAFRDSVLAADNLTLADIQAFLQQNREHPEKYIDYAHIVNVLMDSLEQERLKRRSLDTLAADSSKAVPLTPRP